MPVGRPRSLSVPAPLADPILQEVMVLAKARKENSKKRFDPELGATWEEAEERLKAIRADINLYGEYVYGYTPMPFHRFWNKVVDDVIQRRVPQNKLLLIAPPSTAKSTWNTIIRATHYLGNNPHEHIINITSSDDNAKEFDTAFALIVEENQKFRRVFPDSKVRPYKKAGWSGDGRYFRGIPEGDRHPTYKSVGLNASIMGNRANIILDDPMEQKSAQSEAEQRKAKKYLDQTLIPRLQPKIGWMLACMTRFHEFDLASHMIRLSQESQDWIYIRTPMIAEADDPIGRAIGELLWEERFDQAFIDLERRRMTLAEFNMVHQGNPAGMGGDVFTAEELFLDLPPYFYTKLMKGNKLRTIVVADLAWSENKKACFTVIMTFAIDEDMNMYILNVYRQRISEHKLPKVFTNIIRIAKPIVVALESNNFHKQLTQTLARNIMRQVMCNIQLVTPDKDKRARALLPAGRVENGMVYVDKKRPWYQTFVMECFAGDTPVQAQGVMGAQKHKYTGELVILDTPQGRIRVTPNHPFWTREGWTRAGDLNLTSQILYTPDGGRDHGSSSSVYAGAIEAVARTLFPDVHRAGSQHRWDGEAFGGKTTEDVLRRLEAYLRFDSSDEIVLSDADRACLRGWLDRRRGDYQPDQTRTWDETGSDDSIDNRRIDDMAQGENTGQRSLDSEATAKTGVGALFSVRHRWGGMAEFIRGLDALLDYQEKTHEITDRSLPIDSQQDAQESVARTTVGYPVRNQRAEYQTINAIEREYVTDIDVYNLSTESQTYTVRGYVVHNCLGFPNTRFKDQVDTFSLAAYVVVKLEEYLELAKQEDEPPMLVYGT